MFVDVGDAFCGGGLGVCSFGVGFVFFADKAHEDDDGEEDAEDEEGVWGVESFPELFDGDGVLGLGGGLGGGFDGDRVGLQVGCVGGCSGRGLLDHWWWAGVFCWAVLHGLLLNWARMEVWFACVIVSQYHHGMGDGTRQGEEERAKGMISRNHPVAARILRRWRALTGGKAVRDVDRRTVVACSGGADSVVLAAVLAAVEPRATIAHVVHDLRGDGSAQRDRDAVKGLAAVLECDFVERAVAVKGAGGNLEGSARRLRYKALEEMACEVGAGFVATGHHGDDQVETVLMRMMRGSGVRGMGGIGERVEMGDVVVVRAMLDVWRVEIEALCVEWGLEWVHDATNDDVGYLRNRIRHEVMPMLREIEPGIGDKVGGFARSCGQTSDFLARAVREGVGSEAHRDGDRWRWERARLRRAHRAELAELMFVFVEDVLGRVGADSMGRRAVEACVLAIKSEDTDPCVHRVGPIVVRVDARIVVFSVAGASDSDEEWSCDE